MGQFLACGIAVQFQVIRNSKTEDKDINDLTDIKKHLGKYFSIDNYEVDDKKYSDCFLFTIKKDYLEKNIHNVIRELSDLYYLYIDDVFAERGTKIDLKSENFCQEKYPLKLKYVDEYGKENLRVVGDFNYLNDMESFYDPTWLYRHSDLFGFDEKYKIRIVPAAIWIDYDKYSGEDETNMLLALNLMKNSYFKAPLSENLFFYIFG